MFILGDTDAAAEVFVRVLGALEPAPAVGERGETGSMDFVFFSILDVRGFTL